MGLVSKSTTPAPSSHSTALWLALISTGRVTTLKKVVIANRKIPIQSSAGNTLSSSTPSSSTHCTVLLAKVTTGTRADLRRRGAYPWASWIACPVSCAATAHAAMDALL